MQIKWLGAMFVIVSCGGFGFSIAYRQRQEENSLRSIIRMLQNMRWELQYKLTPLPALCHQAANDVGGSIKNVIEAFALELEQQILPNVSCCMQAAVQKNSHLSSNLRSLLQLLGQSLGKYDLASQVQGLEAVEKACKTALDELSQNRNMRLRNYQTLGLCAGIALAILFL